MRVLRVRQGFQADHSSSSYLFYAVDKPVSKKGQQVAHRFSSRADVDDQSVRYQKWGESNLSGNAYKELLTEHFDVMASESYDWWTLMIAVPKNPQTIALLEPYKDARGYEDLGVDVEDYGPRLVVSVYCMFDYGGPVFEYDEDSLDSLVERLVKIRSELLGGNDAFLRAVAEYYGADEVDEDDDETEESILAPPAPAMGSLDQMTKDDLIQECTARGIEWRKSWTKDRLRTALVSAAKGALPPARVSPEPRQAPKKQRARTSPEHKPGKLSKEAGQIVSSLSQP